MRMHIFMCAGTWAPGYLGTWELGTDVRGISMRAAETTFCPFFRASTTSSIASSNANCLLGLWWTGTCSLLHGPCGYRNAVPSFTWVGGKVFVFLAGQAGWVGGWCVLLAASAEHDAWCPFIHEPRRLDVLARCKNEASVQVRGWIAPSNAQGHKRCCLGPAMRRMRCVSHDDAG